MWLLDTTTGKLHYIADPSRENYAILSHVWISGKEQSFQDLQALHTLTSREAWEDRLSRLCGRRPPSALSKASEKIRECCAFARARGYRWLWADTCCIDKTSSAELSEAINSMYQWYAQAGVCYAFLHDVDDTQDPCALGSQFRQSRWFRRGWTLQELIAPRELVFISKQWRPFGTKASLADVVEEVAGVERAILEHRRPLSTVSVARRMAWAARRKTTRVEDEAYSLMGIFGVNIPTIYGEGRNAFYRLQEEILKHVPDQSIFAWGPLVFERYAWPCAQLQEVPLPETTMEDTPNGHLFAPSPTAFEHSSRIDPLPLDAFERRIGIKVPVPEYAITSYGIRTLLPLVTIWLPSMIEGHSQSRLSVHVAVLACTDTSDGLVALLLRPSPGQNHEQYAVGCRYPAGFVRGVSLRCLERTSRLSLSPLESLSPGNDAIFNPAMTTIYVPYRPFELTVESYAVRHGKRLLHTQDPDVRDTRGPHFVCPCEVVIPQGTITALRQAGYSISGPAGSNSDGTVMQVAGTGSLVCITLSRTESERIYIGLRPCLGAHSSLVPRPLAVLVSFDKPPVHPSADLEPMQRNVTYLGPMREMCKTSHVQDWSGQSATFEGDGRTRVTLTFGAWTDYVGSGNDRGLYALTLDVEA
ncbi:heterokaryon incompatibility protein-domain-containing protein [Trametes gibbosa]|nr:heterokaryon incompatibility protein-domain-containing protein [Trametes gibbosa]